jgi:predicted enzyme related to lactoylglutathione lyase
LTQNTRNPYIPSQTEGCILYLNVGDEDLNVVLSRVEKAGGKILLPITPIEPSGNKGSVAWIMDSEGNRIGLHTR